MSHQDRGPVTQGEERLTDRLLEAREVAEMLAVPERWVREHTRSGFIPCVPLGRYRRYRREAVIAWVKAQEVGGAAWRKHHPRSAATMLASGRASLAPRSPGKVIESFPPSGGATVQASPTPGAFTEEVK